MEEKTHEIISPIRSIFNIRNLARVFSVSPNNANNNGFTLVEILVVIAIIGVLVAAVVGLINPVEQLKRSRDGKRKAEIKQIQTGLELYRSDVGDYPTDAGDVANSGNSLINPDDSTIVYMQSVPKDPKGKYYYYTPLTGGRYSITACSESGSATDTDPDTYTTADSGATTYLSGCNVYIIYYSP